MVNYLQRFRRVCLMLLMLPAYTATDSTPAFADTSYDNNQLADIAFHRPGGPWNTVPVLFANGNGSWTSANENVPSWANQPGVISISGDFDGNGREDIAFHRPGGPWNTVPVLFANGNGSWTSTNQNAPSWANQPGVIAIPGDFNGDERTDIAFHRPGGPWNTVPVLLSNGNGSWTTFNLNAPSWANQQDVIAIPGDFNGDERTDIAFHRPGGPWNTVPVLLSNGNGSWTDANQSAPSWANQQDVIAIPGDFNGDERTDIAFHRPGGPWNTVPILFSNGNGSWASANRNVPSWANQPDVVAISGDFNSDDYTDIAFHRPGGPWNTVPVLLANGTGSWFSANNSAPSWANQPGVVAISGDFNADYHTDIAFHRPGGPWNTVPVLFSTGTGSWAATNENVPSWANQTGVIAITD